MKRKKQRWPTLKGRLSQPLTSHVEAIKQLKTMIEISPLAQKILDREKIK